MSLFARLSLAVIATALLSLPLPVITGPAAAQSYESASRGKPLMVIRFNQRNVYYDRQLYNAVSQAVQVKPSVMFDLVAVSPQVEGRAEQQRYQAATAQHAARVAKSLRSIGVPQSRFTVRQAVDANVGASEVRIYVR